LIKTLIVGGCSIAHGCETYNEFVHEKNIQNSFSQHLANRLGCNLRNVSLSGCSNDYIFFSVMDEIKKTKDIHSVIVSWTALNRITWTHKNRYWMFNPSWATSVERKSDFEFADWKRNVQENQIWYNSDCVENIEILKRLQHFFVDNYLDDDKMLAQKLKTYSESLNAVCQQKNIKLIEVTPVKLDATISAYQYGSTQSWLSQGRHPTAEEHTLIAQELFDKYYHNI
jgi:hypothetical protein